MFCLFNQCQSESMEGNSWWFQLQSPTGIPSPTESKK
jgi:hypothetical protein